MAIFDFGLLLPDLAECEVEGIDRIGAPFFGSLLVALCGGIHDRRTRGPAVPAGVAAG